MNKYVIINAEAIRKRIEELENKIESDDYSGRTCDIFLSQIEILKQILSQSTPLISEIEKAFDAGVYTIQENNGKLKVTMPKAKNDYISKQKLDI